MVRGAAEQAGSMEEFKQGSDEIENIIRTIDNIAFQTNILVLNTAVEATVNRITLCFCPAGDCVLAGLPCQLVELHQFLPQSAHGLRRNFSVLIVPAHAEKAPVPHVDGDEQRFPAVSDIHPPPFGSDSRTPPGTPGPAQSPSGKRSDAVRLCCIGPHGGSSGITNPVPITFPWPGHPPVWPGRTSGLMLRWNLCGQQRIDQAVPLPEVGEFQGLHITQPLDVLNKAFLFL